jgi:hypothetical protein
VSSRPGSAALLEALRDWRHNVSAVLFAVGVLAVATHVGTKGAYYAAGLLIFTAWMAWFVLTCIEWVTLAEF